MPGFYGFRKIIHFNKQEEKPYQATGQLTL